eukprot:5292309-Pleurochrysis_carterae.AAC.2
MGLPLSNSPPAAPEPHDCSLHAAAAAAEAAATAASPSPPASPETKGQIRWYVSRYVQGIHHFRRSVEIRPAPQESAEKLDRNLLARVSYHHRSITILRDHALLRRRCALHCELPFRVATPRRTSGPTRCAVRTRHGRGAVADERDAGRVQGLAADRMQTLPLARLHRLWRPAGPCRAHARAAVAARDA